MTDIVRTAADTVSTVTDYAAKWRIILFAVRRIFSGWGTSDQTPTVIANGRLISGWTASEATVGWDSGSIQRGGRNGG